MNEGKLGDRGKEMEPGEATLAYLKENAMSLSNLYLKGLPKQDGSRGEMADNVKYAPNEWNEHNGIIMFGTKDRVYATPSNVRLLKALQNDPAWKRAEGRGVVNLSDTEIWGGQNYVEAGANSSYKTWRALEARNQPIRDRETAEMMRAQQNEALGITAAAVEAEGQEAAARARADEIARKLKEGNIG